RRQFRRERADHWREYSPPSGLLRNRPSDESAGIGEPALEPMCRQLQYVRSEPRRLHKAVVFALPDEYYISRTKVLIVAVMRPVDTSIGRKKAIAGLGAAFNISSRSTRTAKPFRRLED